jgi:hypothetical protein
MLRRGTLRSDLGGENFSLMDYLFFKTFFGPSFTRGGVWRKSVSDGLNGLRRTSSDPPSDSIFSFPFLSVFSHVVTSTWYKYTVCIVVVLFEHL